MTKKVQQQDQDH